MTGGAGFIWLSARSFEDLLAKGANRVAVVDSLLTGYERNLDEVRGAVDFHKVDIRDCDAVRKAIEGVEGGVSRSGDSVGSAFEFEEPLCTISMT